MIAHEFSHALQREFEIQLNDPNHELQADCLAGVFIAQGSEKLGITREDVISMAWVAYNIGGEVHGTGAQRSYSLLSGMGRANSDCKPSSIQKLVKLSEPNFSNEYKPFKGLNSSGSISRG